MDSEKTFALPDEEFIKAIYRELLGREADPDGMGYYLKILRQKRYPRKFVVRSIKDSWEYRLGQAKSDVPKLVAENKKLNEQEVAAGKTVLQSTPIAFNLDLIGVCNMKPPCGMCLNWVDDTGPRYHPGLTADDFRAFGDPLRLAWDVINCSIGEPLILKDLLPVLDLLSSWEKPFGINSNGLALTPQLTGKLRPFFEILTITFSVDAATPETYAKIRGPHFLKVIENIAYYCERRRQVFPEGAASKTGMVMLPMKLNRHEVSGFIRLAAWLGLDVVELRQLNEYGGEWKVDKGGFLFDYQEQVLPPRELEEVREEAEETAAECGIILDCQYQVSGERTYEAFLPEDKQEGKIKCIQPWHFILPYQNGDTAGCCYMGKSLGNWREGGLESLWNGDRMQQIRKEMAEGKLPRECRQYISCPVVRANLDPRPGRDKRKRAGTINFLSLPVRRR
jgi:MoaA/NifB/PqqE/SkfB family radical SAM enzyme